MKLGKKTLSVILSLAMVSTVAVSSAAVTSAADTTTKQHQAFLGIMHLFTFC